MLAGILRLAGADPPPRPDREGGLSHNSRPARAPGTSGRYSPRPMSVQSRSTPARGPRRSHTKVVATIGPASEDRVGALIDAGMTVARLNFSHGSEEEHRRRVDLIREAARERMTAVGILGDLPGPKMRTGTFPEGSIRLQDGETVEVRAGRELAARDALFVDVADLVVAVQPGHRILVADGMVELVCEESSGDHLVARVRRGGTVGNHKGVHLPDSDVEYELPTAADRRWIEFAREVGVDMLGVSFVGHASEVEQIRSLAPEIKLVSKIERLTALNNIDELLESSDGIMVARGDLGVELELEQLPLAQKSLIAAALHVGKFTITATEMLESMITAPRPTRAEVTDVANAVLDGTDAVMLSAETAVGAHPELAVSTMRDIATAVELSQRYRELPRRRFREQEPTFSNATAMAAVQVADALGLKQIVCFSETGNTVRLISRYRPAVEIIALSPNRSTVQQVTVLANVLPILFRREKSLEDMMFMAAEMLVVRCLADYGDQMVFVAGVPPGIARTTNVMKLHRIGEEVKLH